MGSRAALGRVVVAISAYQSDAEILALLAKIFEGGRADLARVIVVDSLGSGRIQAELDERDWPVRYVNAPFNLGSAGNLALRLKLAAEEDADWCFAINHDGMFDCGLIATLVKKGQSGSRVGAVYPKRIWIDRGHSWLEPHRSVFRMPRFRSARNGAGAVPDEVAWDSSNGALYSLQPIREGLGVWSDLWMGWEDLAYGWALSNAGWKQLFCPEAEYLDDYEYQRVSLLGRNLFIARKPPWYAYFLIRNLVLIVRRTGGGPNAWAFLFARLAREIVFTALFRADKMTRFRRLARGLVDGLRGVIGPVQQPVELPSGNRVPSRPIRVKALLKYGRTAASTRQRLLQFIPRLREAGIEVETDFLLDDDYVRSLATGKPFSSLRILRAYLGRMRQLLFGRRADILWVYAECFPYLPRSFEGLAARRKEPIIYDLDDAFFHQYDSSANPLIRRLLGGKLDSLMRNAAACTCGNQYLQAHAARFCERSILLPTVVDTSQYQPASARKAVGEALVIGWIGSPSTWPYVRPLLPVLEEVSRDHGVRIHVIGAGVRAETDRFAGLELIDWTEEGEIGEVQSMDIGIMPLPDDSWTRGKSGYKLIQYMACGLPVVASPVGANTSIVEDGVTGLLAADLDGWRRALVRLITDEELRGRFGRAARARVEKQYSMERNADRLCALIAELTEGGARR